MPTAFVTGGNGFIGSHLIERLVESGYSVSALVRDPASTRFLPTHLVDVIPGDLADPDALSVGARSADVVFHGAALTRAPSEAEMNAVNVEGTRRMIAACLAPTTPPKLVFVSSQAAAGPSPDGRPMTETSAPRPTSWYGRSKLAAEALVNAHADRLEVACVRPPSVYGPRDDAFLALFRCAARGWLPLPTGARGLSIVHVSDLVEGLLDVAHRGRGTYYLTDGETRPLAEVLGAIASAVGRRVRFVRIPAGLFVGIAWIVERLAAVAGARPPMTYDRARDAVATDWICSDARARAELGYRSRIRLEDGMREVARWYREAEWLR